MKKENTVNFPWPPHMITAYHFGLCSLCEKEKEKDSKFDNTGCPHCKKETKVFQWAGNLN